MKSLYLLIIIFFLCGIAIAQETVKVDRPLDVGVAISSDPLVHEAVYAVLRDKGISCSGLETKKDGTVTILNSSSAEPKITAAEIQTAIDDIKKAQEVEAKIQAEIRAIAIKSLVAKGEIPVDTK
jgi:hypothetical protein